jgi:hypothetical protein
MSAARITNRELMAPEITQTIYQRSLGVGIVFGVLSLITAFMPGTRAQFFHAYLLGFMFWLGISLGSMAFLMIQHLTGGQWGMVIRRQLEAAMKVLPLMAVLFVPIAAAGLPYLYSGNHDAVGGWPGWFHYDGPDQHLKAMSHSYLTAGGFVGRAVIYFAIWIGLMFILNRWSAEQDNPPVQNLSPRFRTIAAPGIILYCFTISFAAIDWVMSIDPHWYSTIFGFIIIVGECLSAMCFMVVVERILVKYEPMASWLKPKEVHDHGKLMLTFIMLWAYFSFSQLLIIWAGNLPQEIRFFTRRLHMGWQIVGLALVVFHFAVPFLMLLSRPLKRDPGKLVWIAVWLMFMRFVDLFWYIEPNFHPVAAFRWGYLVDVLVAVAMGGVWMAMFFYNLRSKPMLPIYDLHAQEFLEYAGVAHE